LNKFNSNDINPINKKSYGELFKETEDRKKIFIEANYKFICIWEEDWNKL
jgi:hypothetical protein